VVLILNISGTIFLSSDLKYLLCKICGPALNISGTKLVVMILNISGTKLVERARALHVTGRVIRTKLVGHGGGLRSCFMLRVQVGR